MASSSSKPNVRLGGIVKKIESPLAKYNSAGQLTCVICNVVVKTEMVWTAHVNGRQHREQVLALKAPKTEPSFIKPHTTTSAVKRKAEPPCKTETSNGSVPSPSKKGVPQDFFDGKGPLATSVLAPKPIKSILKNSGRPAPVVTSAVKKVLEVPQSDQEMDIQDEDVDATQQSSTSLVETMNVIPEGFFDDPKLDAKVRSIEFKDPVEEEWNKFQKEIQEEVTVSIALQEEDQEEATAERQLEEIEEQMMKWGRVIELEQKKELLTQRIKTLRQVVPMEEDASGSSDDETEMDKFFDWRSKTS